MGASRAAHRLHVERPTRVTRPPKVRRPDLTGCGNHAGVCRPTGTPLRTSPSAWRAVPRSADGVAAEPALPATTLPVVRYSAKDVAGRKPCLQRMVATGVPLLGSPDPWQADCAATLAAGPTPLTEPEREWCRYVLTDLLDDLTHAAAPAERTVIGAAAWIAVAEQALALADHWTGSGKWLLRELRDLDAELADRWVAAHGDAEATATLIRQVLDGHGGPLFDGYHVAGQRPAREAQRLDPASRPASPVD